jgi:hypothetical protein
MRRAAMYGDPGGLLVAIERPDGRLVDLPLDTRSSRSAGRDQGLARRRGPAAAKSDNAGDQAPLPAHLRNAVRDRLAAALRQEQRLAVQESLDWTTLQLKRRTARGHSGPGRRCDKPLTVTAPLTSRGLPIKVPLQCRGPARARVFSLPFCGQASPKCSSPETADTLSAFSP